MVSDSGEWPEPPYAAGPVVATLQEASCQNISVFVPVRKNYPNVCFFCSGGYFEHQQARIFPLLERWQQQDNPDIFRMAEPGSKL